MHKTFSVAGKILQTVQVQYALVSRPSFLREELTTLQYNNITQR